MSIMARVLCVYLLYCFLVPSIPAQETKQKMIKFNIDQQYNCQPSVKAIKVEKNESLTVSVTGGGIPDEVHCSTTDSPFLSTADFNRTAHAEMKHERLTDDLNGNWSCTILIRKDRLPDGNTVTWRGHNYTRVDCSVQVNITNGHTAHSSDTILGMEPTTFYIIIGCVVGVLVIIIIIIQTIVIIYYKSRVSRRSELSHLEQRPPAPRDDTARYSTMPLKKCSRSKRQSSGIYQSLENLRSGRRAREDRSPNEENQLECKTPPNIKDRAPMPLPAFNESDDDGAVYGGGRTLERIFSPEPPPIDSLPRNKRKSKQEKRKQNPKPPAKPKPAPIVPLEPQDTMEDMEDYDYADSGAHNSSMNRQLIKKPVAMQLRPIRSENTQPANARPIPPKPCMSELDTILKRRQQTARVQEPVKPETTPPTSSHLPRRPAPSKDVRSPNAWTPPPLKPPIEPRLQGAKASKYPQEEVRSSENARNQDIRPQNVRLADRFEERRPEPRPLVKRPDLARAPQTATVLPMQMMKSPPLPRKPGKVSDDKPPVPGLKRPLPPPPEPESVYEPVAEGSDDDDDDEWKMEPLKPYNIYNI